MSSKQTAVVKWFDNAKGFGFLIDDSGNDVFCHYREIEPDKAGYKLLKEGQQVEYLQTTTDKGLAAKQVVMLVS